MPIGPEVMGELLSVARDKKKANSHRNMGREVSMKRLDRRLLPASRDKYEDKKIILILDKPPYHHMMTTTGQSPLMATKAVSPALLRKLGAGTISVLRGSVHNDSAGPEVSAGFA